MTSIQTTIEAAKKRKGKIMSEVLPTEQIWNEWVKNESRARQGKGYYPSLDRRFLEFLVSCEIDLLSVEHNLALEQPADRIHRNMDKVRRVASQRIGNERLEAYRARVKEAFEAYFRGSVWPTWDEAVSVNSLEEAAYEVKVDQEGRGRGMETKEVRVEVHSQSQVSKQVEKMDISAVDEMDVDKSPRGMRARGGPHVGGVQQHENHRDEHKGSAMAVTSEMEVDQAL